MNDQMKAQKWKTGKPRVQSLKTGQQAVIFATNREESEQGKAVQTPTAAANQRAGQGDAQPDKESSPALFPFNQTAPYLYHIPPLPLLSNPRQQQWQQQPELVNDHNRGAKRQESFTR